MRINSNISALNTNRLLERNTENVQRALERLSSGKRINRASDDAAGMAISSKMKAQVQGLRQASRNALDGISLVQTGEGALMEVHGMLKRMRELSVQGANGVYEEDDQRAIIEEMGALVDEIQMIGETTDFNGIKIFTGQKGDDNTETEIHLQVGANKGESINMDLSQYKIDTSDLGKKEGTPTHSIQWVINTIKASEDPDEIQDLFSDAIDSFDNAISQVSDIRAKMGAIQNRLESKVNSLDNSAENLTSAYSRVEDLDMALEMSEFSKYQVLQQSNIAMLGEANNLPQAVLQLLQ